MPFSSGTFSRVHDFTDDRDNGIRIQASRMDAEMDGIATGLSTALLKDGTQTATATIPFAAGISIIDNQKITLGTNSDITLQYDETTNDSLEIAANVEGAALGIVFKSDQGDDNADQHKLSIADGGVLTLGSKISGSFVDYLTHTPNSTVASSTLAVAGNLTVGGNLTLGSGAVLSEAELEQLDGITAGTVTASKAVVVDANKDIASFRNITLTGELDVGSLDVSGDADIDGTLEADAMTLNGSAITTVATLSTGISNGNLPVFTSGVADDDFLRVNGTAIEGRSASEVLSDIGGQAALTFGISNTNIPIFTSGVADDDFLRVNGTSIEGRSASEVLSDIGASAVAGSSSIVTTGALDSGSITSGFGNINNGTSTLTTGNSDINGTLNVQGETTLQTHLNMGDGDIIKLGADADLQIQHNGSNSIIRDNGTGALDLQVSNFAIVNLASDEFLAKGTADDAFELYHNGSKRFETTSSGVTIHGDIANNSGDLTVDVAGDIILDADNGAWRFKDAGTSIFQIARDSNTSVNLYNAIQDSDIKFQGNDGGSTVTALTFDMSASGDATFNNNVTLNTAFVSTSIVHAGDNDTSLDFTADNQIDIFAGGAKAITIGSSQVIINQDSADFDFRIEGNGDANLLVCDAGSDFVAIGESSQINSGKLNIATSGSDAVLSMLCRSTTDTEHNKIIMQKSSTASGNFAATADDELLGSIIFKGVNTSAVSDIGCQIVAKQNGTDSSTVPTDLIINLAEVERLRLMTNGRLENQSPTNSGNVLQDFRIDWRNENNAGIMCGIGCVRTANSQAPGAFVIRTNTNVDSASNDSDGEISEKFRVAANGDLTATDTSIASNSDSRLKENISDFAYDLDKFKSLKTKTFDWKNPKLHGDKSSVRGFVAQDIETVDSYWVDEVEVLADSDDFQYLEDKDILYTENSTIPVYEEGDTIPDGKKVGDAKYSVGDLEYKARFAKTSKLGQKDAMYVSIIQQLITKIETLETKVATLEGA